MLLRGPAFLSYSRDRFYFAESLTLLLQELGVDAWIDAERVWPGDNWQHCIDQAVAESSHLVLIASETALASQHVRREWRTALAAGKPVIVALVEQITLPSELHDATVSIVDCRTDVERASETIAYCVRHGSTHRDDPRRESPRPAHVRWVARSLLWMGCVAFAMAALLVLLFVLSAWLSSVQFQADRNVVWATISGTLLVILGGRAMWLRKAFLARRMDFDELPNALIFIPFMLMAFTMFLSPSEHTSPLGEWSDTIRIGSRLVVTLPGSPSRAGIALFLCVGAALAVWGFYARWVLLNSADVYRWLATGDAHPVLRRRQVPARPPSESLKICANAPAAPYRIHSVASDKPIAKMVQTILGRPPTLRHDHGWKLQLPRVLGFERAEKRTRIEERPFVATSNHEPIDIAIVSDKTSSRWLEGLMREKPRLHLLVASSVSLPENILFKHQWTDFRTRDPAHLTSLALSLRGASSYAGSPLCSYVVPECLARPVWPRGMTAAAKMLQVDAGILLGTAGAVGTASTGATDPLTFAGILAAAFLLFFLSGLTLQRAIRAQVAVVMAIASIALVGTLTHWSTETYYFVMPLVALVGAGLVGAWYPLPENHDSAPPRLALPAWTLWSRAVFWGAFPIAVVTILMLPIVLVQRLVLGKH